MWHGETTNQRWSVCVWTHLKGTSSFRRNCGLNSLLSTKKGLFFSYVYSSYVEARIIFLLICFVKTIIYSGQAAQQFSTSDSASLASFPLLEHPLVLVAESPVLMGMILPATLYLC